jgi:hypothetical protein
MAGGGLSIFYGVLDTRKGHRKTGIFGFGQLFEQQQCARSVRVIVVATCSSGISDPNYKR